MVSFIVLFFLIFAPFLIIWALGIPLTISTWFATLVSLSTVTVMIYNGD